jgi:hypothetical protein
MRKLLFLCIGLLPFLQAPAVLPDSVISRASVLVIPYNPAMHLSDADADIAAGSEMNMMELRQALRKDLLKALNKDIGEVYDVPGLKNEFVSEGGRDMEVLYHSLLYETDSVYPLKDPKRFAVQDTLAEKKKKPAEKSYINVGIADQMLLPDYSKKYNADYFIFLNEIDIKTHYDDCLNLALKIYRRDLKVHYSVFDKNGKQLYGDVAVSSFDSNTNDVNEIGKKNFPVISGYILRSFNKVAQ